MRPIGLSGGQPEGADIRFGGHLNRTRVDKIIVSPDSEIVVLIYNVDISLRRAEFYRLPASQIDAPLRAIQPYKQKTITGKVESYSDYWVTNQGELFVPRDHGWAAHDNARDVWPVPAALSQVLSPRISTILVMSGGMRIYIMWKLCFMTL